MEDGDIWAFEKDIWLTDPRRLDDLIDDTALFVVPATPFIMTGSEAIAAMGKAPRWAEVHFSEQRVHRATEAIIVIAYRVTAQRKDGDPYEAFCTSTLRCLAQRWRVIQHQQLPSTG